MGDNLYQALRMNGREVQEAIDEGTLLTLQPVQGDGQLEELQCGSGVQGEEWFTWGFDRVEFQDVPANVFLKIVKEMACDIDALTHTKVAEDCYVDDDLSGGTEEEVGNIGETAVMAVKNSYMQCVRVEQDQMMEAEQVVVLAKGESVLVDPLYHTPGELNITDLASSGKADIKYVASGSTWQTGPGYLGGGINLADQQRIPAIGTQGRDEVQVLNTY